MSELFPVEEVTCLSPRLQWLSDHDVNTKKRQDLIPAEGQWEAWIGNYTNAVLDFADNGEYSKLYQYAYTEEDAIVALAKRNGWTLWNETPWN